MKPNPSPEAVFGNKNSNLLRIRRVGRRIVEETDSMVGGSGGRNISIRRSKQERDFTVEQVLGFVKSQTKAVESSELGLEMSANSDGKTVIAIAEKGENKTFKDIDWILRVVDDETSKENIFWVKTESDPKDFDSIGQNRVRFMRVINPRDGKEYSDFKYSPNETIDVHRSVGIAFATLSIAQIDGSLQVAQLQPPEAPEVMANAA